MRISTKLHGIIDYAAGALLLLLPSGLGWADDAAGAAMMVVGIALILNTFATHFEYGFIKVIHVPLHLWVDGLLGLLLAISPWLLSFDRTGWLPHLVVGIVIIVFAFFTQTIPGYDRRGAPARNVR
jgi:hypothetical protein